MSFIPQISHADIFPFIRDYGYWFVAVIVGIESLGIPLPGETALVMASIYCARTGHLNIAGVVAAASIGSIIGNYFGFLIGRRFGYPLLLKHGPKIGINEDRIKLGQYLFMNYGGGIVFVGRFIALLRILAAFLAGVNRMPWPTFWVANVFGAFVWAGLFGFGGYEFGKLIFEELHMWAPIVAAVVVVLFFGIGYVLHRYEKQLVIHARAALPGPLELYRVR